MQSDTEAFRLYHIRKLHYSITERGGAPDHCSAGRH